MSIYKKIYLSIVIYGVIFGYSCKCKKDYENCNSICDEYIQEWLTEPPEEWKYRSSSDSSKILKFTVDTLTGAAKEIVRCFPKTFGGCNCNDCDGEFDRNILDSSRAKVGSIKIKIQGNREGDRGRYFFRLDWREGRFVVDLPASLSSTHQYVYFEQIELENGTHDNVFRFFRTKTVDGVSVEIPGYIFYNIGAGILQFEDPNTGEVFVRID